ncbi:26S protease regulatory subunit 7, partial [Fasciola gigantica]
DDFGGCKRQTERLRVLVEVPHLYPKQLVNPEIDSPDCSPGAGRTLCARAAANSTDASFIRIVGRELMQNNVGEGARMVRGLLESVRSKGACKIFSDQIETLGSALSDDGADSINEVQPTVQELVTIGWIQPTRRPWFQTAATPWILLRLRTGGLNLELNKYLRSRLDHYPS